MRLVLPFVCALSLAAQDQKPVVPHLRQLAWHELEYCAFVHFGINTFTNAEWGTGKEDPALFAPTSLDCRQWTRVCRDAGMKGIILTAKHHDGFCLWQTETTRHSVASSGWKDGKGDVVRELADACREHGLKLGIYLSPWDRNCQVYGSDAYNAFYRAQQKELLSRYGEVFEFWMDGACGEGPSGTKQVYEWKGYWQTVRELQPSACIFSDVGPDVRWVGNENGLSTETCWCTMKPTGEPGKVKVEELAGGHRDGTQWLPAECDVSIRPGWFYHPEQDSKVKTREQLLEIWHRSIGMNASLLLNLPVDRRGLVHEIDAARLIELRRALDAIYGQDLVKSREGDQVDFDRLVMADRVVLGEDITRGQHVEAFAIEAFASGAWQKVASGTTIGRKRIVVFQPLACSKLRVQITKTGAPATLAELGVYCAPTSPAGVDSRRDRK